MTTMSDIKAARVNVRNVKTKYTNQLGALATRRNAVPPLPVTDAMWADLIVNYYDPLTKAQNALGLLIDAAPDVASGAPTMYRSAEGATVVASSASSAPDSAYLIDAQASAWRFGAASGNDFAILRNGAPLVPPVTGIMMKMVGGKVKVQNAAGAWTL